MKRIVEPELMSDAGQAQAYAAADFESAHRIYPRLFAKKFRRHLKQALALDLGCGPCDVTIRFAWANPGWTFHAVDGSTAMLEYGRAAVARARLSVILSSSFLHHLHDPSALWKTVRRCAKPGTIVFVPDLRRPATRARARTFVEKYSGTEPEVLKRDFFNSLLAAFTPAEVRRQLKRAGLDGLKVEVISDRHLVVFGKIQCFGRSRIAFRSVPSTSTLWVSTFGSSLSA
jgi:ubiquinone/menaquinone biosynthesis C-methylase UbiE